ncbi:hypothetical protein JXB02_05210 [Candidatus Woesearchaeota archaeon]|nr:hypothetical protein [Candidatus Woesearchaeota archaeon]
MMRFAVRRRTSPNVIKAFQEEVIAGLGEVYREDDLRVLLARGVGILKRHLAMLRHATAEDLAMTVRLQRVQYRVDCPQKAVAERLRASGKQVNVGESVRYVIEDHAEKRYVPLEHYRGGFDAARYALLMKEALVHVFLPFAIDTSDIDRLLARERQLTIGEALGTAQRIRVLVAA